MEEPLVRVLRKIQNQTDCSRGITLPSLEAQIALIKSTYAAANLELSSTDYFEAHGTGT